MSRRRASGPWLFTALVYVPVLLTDPGKVAADTKTYLYLDISRFLAGASSMWDPKIGMGTVSHQTIGYLFPMGPFFWVTEALLGLPAWVAQRLWLGTLVLAAGFGVRYLLRVLGIDGPGVGVAMLAYAFSPYVIEFSPRLSVLLGPWAALPWLIGFVVLATRHGGWRYPALFAITVQLVGGVNASSLLFVLIGPALWLPYAVVVLRECSWRRVWSVTWRTGVLTLVTSLWWMSGLWVQGGYGLDILRFSESLRSVSFSGLPSEALRGLGYWFFYGSDRGVWWNDGVHDLVGNVWLLGLSFVIPVLAIVATAALRWRDRAYFVVLVLVGLVIADGASPYNNPSILGGWFKAFASSSTAGFALRSTARAVPLVALGFAVLLGAGVSSAVNFLRSHDRPQLATAAIGVIGALCILNAPQIWHGRYYTKDLERSSQVPVYYRKALAALDAKSHATRVLALPGADFAAYRWGNTVDPIEPGLMDRPYVARELIPWGSEPAANLLRALDHRFQEGNFEQQSLAPIARLMGVGDILLRMDLATNRFALVSPSSLWSQFVPNAPDGTGTPVSYGPSRNGAPPPLAVVSVKDPSPIVRAKPVVAPIVVDGDGEGLVDAAASGLVDASHAVLYSASYEQQPKTLAAMVNPQTWLVVTDSNRRRAERWSGMIYNFGYTEMAGERPMRVDPTDQRLEVFPGSDDTARTVMQFRGVRSVQATGYGSPGFGYTLAQRPAKALDGEVATAWEVGQGLANVGDQRLRIVLDHPITTDHVNLVQAITGQVSERWIHAVTLRFDGKSTIRRTLDPASQASAGQDVTFGTRTFQSLEIGIDSVKPANPTPGHRTPVGFSEVRLRDGAHGAVIRAHEVLEMPRDLLTNASIPWATTPLALVMTRNDDTIADRFSLPGAREFAVSGGAKLFLDAPDLLVDRVIGIPDASEGGVSVSSSGRFLDNLSERGSAALDGDPSTSWVPGYEKRSPWLQVEVPKPRTFDHLDLRVLNGGANSVPTRVSIRSDNGTVRDVALPAIPDSTTFGSSALVPLRFAPISGRQFTVTFTAIREVPLPRPYPAGAFAPIAVAELGIPALQADVPAQLPGACVSGLATVDGNDIPVRLTGTPAALLRGQEVALSGCGSGSSVALGRGAHEVEGAAPRESGVSLQRIVLRSAVDTAASPTAAARAPTVRVLHESRSAMTVGVDGAVKPFWLILGESHSRGWVAKAGGKDLGAPKLVDGYANGWLVTPTSGRSSFRVTLDFSPQRVVNAAVVVSTFAVLACLIVIGVSIRRRTTDPALIADEGVASVPGPGKHALGNPALPFGASPGLVTGVVTALVTGAVAAVVVRPWVGVLVALLAFVAVRRAKGRVALTVGAPLLFFGVACYTTFEQLLHHYPAGLAWPTYFEGARTAGLLSIVLLATDALVEMLQRRSDRQRELENPG